MLRKYIYKIYLYFFTPLLLFLFVSNVVKAQTYDPSEWFMAGANPQRASHVDSTGENMTALTTKLYVQWYHPIEPYINYSTQVIVADNVLYISSSKGLYAFNADTGDLAWVYPTDMPLGDSPTVINDTVYVGGFDRRIHAIDATPDQSDLATDPTTGQPVNTKVRWLSEPAGGGFDTNPLVIDTRVYATNRDGKLYVYDTEGGVLQWTYQTGGPVNFSPAYKNGVIYLASQDMHVYAINTTTHALMWKTAQKLPGEGFFTYWPVIYTDPDTQKDYVIVNGAENYPINNWGPELDLGNLVTTQELHELYPHYGSDPRGTLIGLPGNDPWVWSSGTNTIDTSKPNDVGNGPTNTISGYFENKPYRRTVFVLDAATGGELTYSYTREDGTTGNTYAPYLWSGTSSGPRYPAVVGGDGVIYMQNNYRSDLWIAGGGLSGWKFGTPILSIGNKNWTAVDEPHSFSTAGNVIYAKNLRERELFTVNLSNYQETSIIGYDLDTLALGYASAYSGQFGSSDGIYGTHGAQSPAVPYKGRLYIMASNSLMAFSKDNITPEQLPLAKTVAVLPLNSLLTDQDLKQRLSSEIQKIIGPCQVAKDWQNCHLRPAYYTESAFYQIITIYINADYLTDYFHNPADTIAVLLGTLPFVTDPQLKSDLEAYIQSEYNQFPPDTYAHIGWDTGQPREWSVVPPEIESQMSAFGKQTSVNPRGMGHGIKYWTYPPYNIYAVWKYAEHFGGAAGLFAKIQSKLKAPPADADLTGRPFVNNAFITGYIGYIQLHDLAVSTGMTPRADIQTYRDTLDHLLTLRADTFSTYPTVEIPNGERYRKTLNISGNFLYMVPELADHLRTHAVSRVTTAITEYDRIAPYWFVGKLDVTFGEGSTHPLYDVPSVFQARAHILGQSREVLAKYLDVPVFERGDLFYIDNLVSLLEAPTHTPPPQGDLNGDNTVNIQDIIVLINEIFTPSGVIESDINSDGKVDILDVIALINMIFS
ncbi:hypothetical protein COV24_00105 [candidate division WWE3 bacterium CG10_big_fil_rev_8_21_14_0_10_32_10]|uniref:Dockerin domain-containing protein n=1 Tax=candidate division WWE3 bacterium CG10_big_fil_rev_8_21_14_0_10_32_10 TaxID=1975090 RepID=A0A2H0RBM6_UNCKA|nr:MAG: hypothetical protein COV24_00105 [candidate division WWE3 bacterium CG10_big_fil_rev_8_21_14_0_10_32_10]